MIIGNCETLKIINRFGVVDLKLRRNLCVIVTGIVACSLFVGGFAEWKSSGIGGGGLSRRVLIWSICTAVGVVWLSWYWLRLGRAITSIANRLRTEQPADIKLCNSAIVKELNEAIDEKFGQERNRRLALEKQIEDLQIQIQLSQRQKRNIEAIIYSIRDAVIVIDESDRLLMANEAAGVLFNFDFRSSQHKPVGELIGADKSEFVDFLHQSRQTGGRHTRREIVFEEGDKTRTYDCIVSCVYDTSTRVAAGASGREQVCGVVAVLHDVTREKEISQMKNDFVSHVSQLPIIIYQ